jgi:urease accessory protein
VLAASSVALPLQIQRPRQGPDGEAIVTLLTPAGALFDGDRVELHVDVQSGARVVLRQASATQLHRSTAHGISFDLWLTVAAGARCSYLPFELIPFTDADYRQTIRMDLAVGGELCLTEVVTPGRVWEHFQYRRLALRTEVRLDGELIVWDAQHIEPAELDIAAALGGYTHFATLLRLGPNVGVADADRLHERLTSRGICGSASVLPRGGIGARALGTSAYALLQGLAPI